MVHENGESVASRDVLAAVYRPNLLPLPNRQRLEDGLGSRLGAFRNHVKNAGAIDIGEDADVVMPLPEALFVDAQVGHVRRLPTL